MARFSVDLSDEDWEKLARMAALSHSRADKSVLVRQLIRLSFDYFEEFIKVHSIPVGEVLGLEWIGEAYNPALIEQYDQVYSEQLKEKYKAEGEGLDQEYARNQEQLDEIEARRKELENELNPCENCEDRALANIARAAQSDPVRAQNIVYNSNSGSSSGWWASVVNWWELMNPDQQQAINIALWGILAVCGFVAFAFYIIGRSMGRW